MFDGQSVGEQMVVIVRDFVTRATAGLSARMDVLAEQIKAIPAGPQGERGAAGEKGMDGAPGAAGRDGSSLLVGEGPPLAPGKSGDVYLDSKTGDLYRCD